MNTRQIVLECAQAIEDQKRSDLSGTIDLLPYFIRVIDRTLEAAAKIAEGTKLTAIGENVATRSVLGKLIAENIRAKMSRED